MGMDVIPCPVLHHAREGGEIATLTVITVAPAQGIRLSFAYYFRICLLFELR